MSNLPCFKYADKYLRQGYKPDEIALFLVSIESVRDEAQAHAVVSFAERRARVRLEATIGFILTPLVFLFGAFLPFFKIQLFLFGEFLPVSKLQLFIFGIGIALGVASLITYRKASALYGEDNGD